MEQVPLALKLISGLKETGTEGTICEGVILTPHMFLLFSLYKHGKSKGGRGEGRGREEDEEKHPKDLRRLMGTGN